MRVLAAVNRRILRDTHVGQFVTVFYGVLDPHTGQLTYASTGHPPPYRLHEARMQPLPRTGMPLGILEEAQWEQRTVTLQPGDLCLMYTDGVTEAQNAAGEFFDRPRLAEKLRRNADRSAEEIRSTLLADLKHFTGDVVQADGITLLVLARIDAAGMPKKRQCVSETSPPAGPYAGKSMPRQR